MKLFQAMKKALGITLADRIENAINRAANLAAEAQKYEMRERLYNKALEHIEPHEEWNLFATLKQKAYDAHVDFLIADRRYRDAATAAHKLIDEGVIAPRAPMSVSAVFS